jgi:uncharacterized repeat protein (TIGR01451 family)
VRPRSFAARSLRCAAAAGLAALLAALAWPAPLQAHAEPCVPLARGSQSAEWLGFALAAEAAQNRLAVGAPGDGVAFPGPGSVQVFERSGPAETWSEAAVLPSPAGGRARFGFAVSASGNRVAVGAPAADSPRAPRSGAVYVFVKNGGGWRLEATITAIDAATGAQFGSSVSLDDDTLAVGAPAVGDGGSLSGAAYVFRWTDAGWSQQQKLRAPDAQPAEQFGFAVALEGELLAVGSPFRDDPPRRRNFGALSVFRRVGGVWILRDDRDRLTAQPFQENDVQFGAAVALDGGSILAGARGADHDGAPNAGTAYVFRWSGAKWERSDLASADRGADDQFGAAVALQGDHAAVGAPFHPAGGRPVGAAFSFLRRGSAWDPVEPPGTGKSPAQGARFGGAVAVLGPEVLVGGPRDDPDGKQDAGSVVACPAAPPPCEISIAKTADPPGTVQRGAEISYTVRVTNLCQRLLQGVAIEDDFSSKLDEVKWCSAEGAGSCTPILHDGRDIAGTFDLPADGRTFHVTARIAPTAAGELVNEACAAAPGQKAVCQAVRNRIGSSGPDLPDLQVEITAPATVFEGTALPYTVTVENRGAATATGVFLKGPAPPGLGPPVPDPCRREAGRCLLGDLRPGAKTTISFGFQLPECSSPPLGSIPASVEVGSREPDLHPADDHDSASTQVLVRNADLAIVKTVLGVSPPGPACSGAAITYRLAITNDGPGTACGAEMQEAVPAGLTFRSAACPPPISCPPPVAGSWRCPLGNLPSGGGIACDATFELARVTCPSAEVVNTITVRSARPDSNPANDRSSARAGVDLPADLAITKTDGLATATTGDPLLYTLVARNTGCCDVAGATVRDVFPPDLTKVRWCEGADCTPNRNEPLEGVVDLPVGASKVFLVQGVISPLLGCSRLDNPASVTLPAGLQDAHPEDNEVVDMTEVSPPPGVSAFCAGISGSFVEGGAITKTVVLLNGGPNAQADNPGPEFSDTLPAGLTLVSAAADSGTVATALNTVTWNGAIPVCGKVTITIDATIDAGTAGTTLCNQGTASFDADGDGINESMVLTDDPDLPGPADPCCLRVATAAEEIPALPGPGLAALALLLAGLAARRLARPRRPPARS